MFSEAKTKVVVISFGSKEVSINFFYSSTKEIGFIFSREQRLGGKRLLVNWKCIWTLKEWFIII